MPSDVARNFARCDRGLVVAPAGCGKTHLIAESVCHTSGTQLILTHTHAGVGALHGKLAALGVPPAKYRVTTIDSLALCYANAFPGLAGWECDYPSDNEGWSALRTAASRVFRCRAPRGVLRASYAGVFVDEYQDCCGTQHEIIKAITKALPCRIVGDPLQAIYRKLHTSDIAKWSDVVATFPVVGVLEQPHRWLKHNAKLGEWLGYVRLRLEKATEVDFCSTDGAVKWVPSADIPHQIEACYKAINNCAVVAICNWPAQCAAIAGKTQNQFSSMESVECPDLLEAAGDIEGSSGPKRVDCIAKFARKCLTKMNDLTDLTARLKKADQYRPRSLGKLRLWTAMRIVAESSDLRAVLNLISAVDSLPGTRIYKRREPWREMRRTLQAYSPDSGKSLRETAWAIRDYARKNGRRNLAKRTVATPLLIKGLEFDEALLLDAGQMGSPEELYVALTRGSSSLTILSSKRKVKHQEPTWVSERG